MAFKETENIHILRLSYSKVDLTPAELISKIRDIIQVKGFMIGQYPTKKKYFYDYEVILCVDDLPYRVLAVKDYSGRWEVPGLLERQNGWKHTRSATHKELVSIFTRTDIYFTNIKPPFFLGIWLFFFDISTTVSAFHLLYFSYFVRTSKIKKMFVF